MLIALERDYQPFSRKVNGLVYKAMTLERAGPLTASIKVQTCLLSAKPLVIRRQRRQNATTFTERLKKPGKKQMLL